MYQAAFAFSALCLLASAASAQTTEAPPAVVSGVAGGSGTGGGGIAITLGGPPLGPAVTGAPYSAEQEQVHVQTLADGTHITQNRSVQKLWRDSQGRTRVERTLGPGLQLPPGTPPPPTMIELTDPVQGVRYVLDTQNKIAHRSTVPQRSGTIAVRNAIGQPVGTSAIVSPSPAALPAATRPNTPQVSNEDLGMQVIEGLSAQGHRSTTTYPVDFFGNDRPVMTTSEIWTSVDLKVTVLSKNSDPRDGESTVRLTNISRVEPDPALFQPPADYTIEDATAGRITGTSSPSAIPAAR